MCVIINWFVFDNLCVCRFLRVGDTFYCLCDTCPSRRNRAKQLILVEIYCLFIEMCVSEILSMFVRTGHVCTHLDNWRILSTRVVVWVQRCQITKYFTYRCVMTIIVKIFAISAKTLNNSMMLANVTRCPFVNLIKWDSQYQ